MKRIYSLDLLKFILASYLMLGHFQQDTGLMFRYINVFDNPNLEFHEVELFFLISGFLACNTIPTLQNRCFKDYIVNKIVRLWPMVFLSVTFGELAIIYWYYLTGNVFTSFGFWNLLNSYLLTFQGGAINNIGLGINNPTWYICVLLICYCLLYFVVFISNRINTPYIWYVVAILFLGIGIRHYGIDLPFMNSIVARGYTGFFGGIIFYNLYNKINHKRIVSFGAFVICIVILVSIFKMPILIDNRWGINCFILHPALMIVFLQMNNIMHSSKWSLLGGISYEMYIWHAIFIIFYNCFLYTHPIISVTWSSEKKFIVFALFTIIFSWAMYVFFESRITNIFKRIIQIK